MERLSSSHISPTTLGLGVILFAAFAFMYEWPNLLIFPLNFVAAVLIFLTIIFLGWSIIRE